VEYAVVRKGPCHADDAAWKLVTKRRSREARRRQFPQIRMEGDEALGLHEVDMVSVMT
jgi:hypothetical protein